MSTHHTWTAHEGWIWSLLARCVTQEEYNNWRPIHFANPQNVQVIQRTLEYSGFLFLEMKFWTLIINVSIYIGGSLCVCLPAIIKSTCPSQEMRKQNSQHKIWLIWLKYGQVQMDIRLHNVKKQHLSRWHKKLVNWRQFDQPKFALAQQFPTLSCVKTPSLTYFTGFTC